MKIKVNSEVIKKFNPCTDRINNWEIYYSTFNGDITKFLHLENITYSDKIWVVTKIVPTEILVIWALDSVFAAVSYAYAAYTAYAAAYADAAADAAAYAAYTADAAADAAAYAADAAAYAADAERERQIEALIYLIKGE